VAKAYVDQLERQGALSPSIAAELRTALNRSQRPFDRAQRDRAAGAKLRAMADDLAPAAAGRPMEPRMAALKQVLNSLAEKLS
jgi:hypothetical protein